MNSFSSNFQQPGWTDGQFSFLHVKYLKSLKAENYIFSKFKEIFGLKTPSFNSFGSLELKNTVRDFFVIV